MIDFDLNNFKKEVNDLKPLFEKFRGKSIENINLDEHKKEIKHIFETFSAIKGAQFTGASKLMHLTVPEVFIMWDGYIRKAWGFKKGDSEDYFNFLKKMQEEFKGLNKRDDRTMAKCIDEYNNVKFTLPVLNKNRVKKLEDKR